MGKSGKREYVQVLKLLEGIVTLSALTSIGSSV